ncbi:hypothetical protein BDZ45DRAFT_779057 [Acephala macrosclerotiorum]|nr:hypothetical protein BDZ45DRAFT_779057 [Acephala macrosclerotiorum]
MSRILASRQAEELHKFIVVYLSANSLSNTAAALRTELNLGENVFDATTAKKYETLLEKKWTSVIRLQKKINLSQPNLLHILFSLQFDSATFFSLSRQRIIKGYTKAITNIDYSSLKNYILLVFYSINRYKNTRILSSYNYIISTVRFMLSEDILTIRGHSKWIRNVCFSLDGSFNIFGSRSENKLTIFDHENFIECCVFASPSLYYTLEFMAIESRDKTIKLWDMRGISLVFYPGGKYLLSVDRDRPPINGETKESLLEVQIRCVIATGSVDMKLKIFAM